MTDTIVMYVGLNDRDAHEQLHSVEWFINRIAEYFDCTITPCKGVYRGEVENSLRLDIYGLTIEDARMYARKLCVEFNQAEIVVNGEFISADAA